MHWYSLAMLAAVAVSTRDAWVKRHFSCLGPYDMALFPLLYSLPLFLASSFLVPKPPLDATFWHCVLLGIPLEIAATIIYMESLRVSPLSLAVPYLALTPAFTLLTGRLLLHEMPNSAGTIGILTIVVGSYILNLNPQDRGVLAPFKAMAREKGCRLMLMVAIIYSMTSVLGRKAILHSSPLFFGSIYCLILCTVMLVLLIASGRSSLRSLTAEVPKGAVAGGLFFLELIVNSLALGAVQAAYMISVKRLSVVIGVLYGGLLFRERHIFYRALGALVMSGGAVVISLWGM